MKSKVFLLQNVFLRCARAFLPLNEQQSGWYCLKHSNSLSLNKKVRKEKRNPVHVLGAALTLLALCHHSIIYISKGTCSAEGPLKYLLNYLYLCWAVSAHGPSSFLPGRAVKRFIELRGSSSHSDSLYTDFSLLGSPSSPFFLFSLSSSSYSLLHSLPLTLLVFHLAHISSLFCHLHLKVILTLILTCLSSYCLSSHHNLGNYIIKGI